MGIPKIGISLQKKYNSRPGIQYVEIRSLLLVIGYFFQDDVSVLLSELSLFNQD